MEYVIIFILIFATIVFVLIQSQKKKDHEADIQAITKLADHANHFASNINAAKSFKNKIKNAEQAHDMLMRASAIPNHKEVISNYDEMVSKLEAMIKVLPVAENVEKAEKNRFKKKDSAEKNNLLDALYEIRNNNITDHDFDLAELHDDKTGEIVTIKMVENRLKELGWEE